ncbi:MAG: ribosome hibernation-promoting factor, HPF/YfiA family, partial [Nitrospinota bacterium]
MQITLRTRKIELTDALKRHAEERLGRLEKFMDKGVSAHYVLSVEKYRHTAELTIRADGAIHHSKEITGDMYLSIDRVVHKMEKQLKRNRERRRSLKRGEKVASGRHKPTE